MSLVAMIGLVLQLLGTVLTGFAIWGEWGDWLPKVQPPKRPHVGNPWEGRWRATFPKVWDSDRRDYQERLRRQGTSARSIGSDPELLGMAEYTVAVFREAREDLYTDWERQERDQAELHAATVALFESLQEAEKATRERVRLEMVGLLIVAVGTVLSSF